MLRRLMVRLGAEDSRASSLLAAGNASKEERARLSRGADGAGSLDMQEAFDRAWRRVGLALDRVGFTVEDRDRSQGMYFVRYIDPEADAGKKDDKGFLSKLAFWKSGKSDTPQSSQYRIHIKGDSAASTVRVLTREGGVDNSETARKILALLHEQLK
jgi:outer membrane protein assembly factor BamC